MASSELDPWDDTAVAALLWPTPALVLCELDLAPPVLTTWPEPALADRFDDAIAGDDPFDPALEELPVEEFPLPADDPVDESAQATPYPVENNAAPTPRATANPPTRPTNREAPMSVSLPTDGNSACAEGKPASAYGSANSGIRQLGIC
ncbi:hypothetical protein [Mycolicibacterium sphagni]|uniref:hypothetical protein n=1 Tax=Mycolicibacterium sphagni TaxID=1786 RepID=UPI0021F2B18B|nr:hypothetical protein [Mycolicibacterium sphagni]MCV7176688.1 hypothetical protein [Mycolicibacterium sphagni]